MNLKGEIMHSAIQVLQPVRRYYWRTIKPQRFGVKVAVQSPESRDFLLVQHSYEQGEVLTFPGGGYKPKKESSKEAAAREVRQELGLEIGRVGIIGEYSSNLEGKQDTVTCLHGLTEGGQLKLNAEIASARWVSADELQEVKLSYAGLQIVKFLREADLI